MSLEALRRRDCRKLPGALIRVRLFEDLVVPVNGGQRARDFVLGAPVGLCSLKGLELPVLGSLRARVFVPVAPVGPRPLEDL